MTDKPPYRIPTMGEIDALTPNGYQVVSTFSGCGGSSLGYRMAGFTVLAASEFVPAAAEVYRMNSRAVVDTRDIRSVNGVEWMDSLGLAPGELDVLDGSPPCASFSLAGKRSKTWGQVKTYSDTKQRTDDLFMEFARLLEEIRPKVFIAENVPGLRQGSSKGYFKMIVARLREAGYSVQVTELDSMWLGVPQQRRRLIFMGVRDDLSMEHRWPTPDPYFYSLRDALPYLDGQVSPDGSGPSDGNWSAQPGWLDAEARPSRTIGASPSTGNGRFPPMVTELATASNYHGIDRHSIESPTPTMTSCGMAASQHARVAIVEDAEMAVVTGLSGRRHASKDGVERYSIDEPCPTITTKGVTAVDTKRAVIVESTPRPLRNAAGTLVDPETGYDIGNVSIKLRRFYPGRSLRRLTIGELRRICGFPDDFALAGSYAQRWERLGRAVPPPMMAAVGRAVQEMLDG